MSRRLPIPIINAIGLFLRIGVIMAGLLYLTTPGRSTGPPTHSQPEAASSEAASSGAASSEAVSSEAVSSEAVSSGALESTAEPSHVAFGYGQPDDQAPARVRRLERPSAVLSATLEALSVGDFEEMAFHFTHREQAQPFFQQWQGKLPAGRVLVEHADQVDAGGENGHLLPVAVWLNDMQAVAGMKGEVHFKRVNGKVQIQTLQLDPVPLRISTWAAAAQHLVAAYPSDGPPQPAATPFFGCFRFKRAQESYCVNGLTGDVERE